MDEGDEQSRLRRSLTTADAVVIGLGSMVGAGIFVVVAPAAAAAGPPLLLGLLVAGTIAYMNATSSAQLAALYPRSGGTYAYGRMRLGHFWGFMAGWGFLAGKVASCAAIALTFGTYLFPTATRSTALLLVVVVTAINYRGVRKTALSTRVIVAFVFAVLAMVGVTLLTAPGRDWSRITDWEGTLSLDGVAEAAALLFFAFAGYARIATLGEEVKDPQRAIPRAIPVALVVALFAYLMVAIALLVTLPLDVLAGSDVPLARALEVQDRSSFVPIVKFGAGVASAGVLLSLLAGIARTVFAMAAERDLPRWFDAVHPRHRIPHRAEVAVAGVVAITVALAEVEDVIAFSAMTVLTYYAITNAAALTLVRWERRWPRWMALTGMAGCISLALALPVRTLIPGSSALLVGMIVYAGRQLGRSRSTKRV
jgi:APA family basic amino acid/polyamine antiporter